MLNYLVKKAKYVDDYKVWLAFADGISGEVDLEKTVNVRNPGVFAPLQDINYFKKFKICGDTLAWGKDADLAPEFLYDLCLKQNKIPKPKKIRLPKAPEISRFLGIKISMDYKKNATPCFYAKKGKYEVTIHIKPEVMEGEFLGDDLTTLFDWMNLHRKELLANWQRAAQGKNLNKIEPLTA